MNYVTEFKKFITGQYLTKGLRVTVGAVLPALLLYQFNWLSIGIALPLGALMVSLTDSPGPIHHRRNGMLVSNVVNFTVALIIGYTRSYPLLLGLELVLLSFFLSFIGIYGNRANAIGLIAIIVIVLNIDVHSAQERVLSDALYMLCGGIWYMILSLLLYSLRPYRLIQQALGECIIIIGAYLKTKSKLYKPGAVEDDVYKELLPLQINIHNQQEQLRELLFKARGFTRESTGKGRILLMMFLDSVDLFEQVMTSQQNYKSLQNYFKEGAILETFRKLIVEVANELDRIGLVIQSGFPARDEGQLDDLIKQTEDAFVLFRDTHLNAGNIEGFISLRHVLNAIKDIAERIKRLHKYSVYSSVSGREVKPEIDVKHFVSKQEFDIGLLAENFSLQSNIFRHSLRVSICMLTGYLIAQFLPFGHGYWILLTIVTILKPAYSISKKRNAERLTGTIAGAATGFLLLYYVQNNSILFTAMIFSMIIAYSFLQIQYALSVAAITVYVLLSFHFLHPADFKTLTTDRLIDTAIGSFISFAAALFFLPKWAGDQLKEYLHQMMEANLHYFSTVAQAFYKEAPEVVVRKVARKEAYVALANLSDAFQRLLSEPKKNNRQPQLLHHLVVSNHMLTSHIATLAIYGHSLAPRYHSDAFKPVSNSIEVQMRKGIALSKNEGLTEEDVAEKGFMKIRDMVRDLLQIRLKELKEGTESSNVRKELSGFKTITDQFEMIYTITVDANNTLVKMKEGVAI